MPCRPPGADDAHRRVVEEGVEQAIALLPPPTQAVITSGRRPNSSSICARARADDRVEVAHHARIRIRRPRCR
jgi:hypothetical protein